MVICLQIIQTLRLRLITAKRRTAQTLRSAPHPETVLADGVLAMTLEKRRLPRRRRTASRNDMMGHAAG